MGGQRSLHHRKLSTVTLKVMILIPVLKQTQEIVFLALQDLERNQGDTLQGGKTKHFQSDLDSKNKGRTCGIKPCGSDRRSERCEQGEESDSQPRISYSVS